MEIPFPYWLTYILALAILLVIIWPHRRTPRNPGENEADPLLKPILRLRDRVVKKAPRVYWIGGIPGMGVINWQDNSQVVGWHARKPERGDLLLCRMASGYVGLFVFTKVENVRRPADMFFGEVSIISYADDSYGTWVLSQAENKPSSGFFIN